MKRRRFEKKFKMLSNQNEIVNVKKTSFALGKGQGPKKYH